MCMLSVSSFPKGYKINRKSLIRRWIAEGLVVGDVQLNEDRVACDCLDRLVDLGIVDPVPRCGRASKVKRCQVHGVMLEFLVHRSVSWNFITLISEGRAVRNHDTRCAVRRLCVHGVGEIDRVAEDMELSRIRSLTVCNTNSPMSLKKCELLRVLDLEGCGWLRNDHLDVICGLLYLKYLSLRRTQVSELPGAIKDLLCLETLDARETRVDKLPLEVIMLPRLAHLFGKFQLPEQLGNVKREDELTKFLSEKSMLQTLSGFKIIDNNRSFEKVLLHAKMLKKVKIWCEVPPDSTPPPDQLLQPAQPRVKLATRVISRVKAVCKRFNSNNVDVVSSADMNVLDLWDTLSLSLKRRFTGAVALDSLSVHFGGHCKDFLESVIKDPCGVSSIKIWGEMERLPDSHTLKMLRNIKELHLSDTGLRSDDLSVLQSLDCLVTLKLAEHRQYYWDGNFCVQTTGFPSLHRLCFDGTKLPNVEFQPGAMASLISLQIICLQHVSETGIVDITNLQHLDEVILHPKTPDAKLDAWKEKAMRHKNRPYVQRQPENEMEQ